MKVTDEILELSEVLCPHLPDDRAQLRLETRDGGRTWSARIDRGVWFVDVADAPSADAALAALREQLLGLTRTWAERLSARVRRLAKAVVGLASAKREEG